MNTMSQDWGYLFFKLSFTEALEEVATSITEEVWLNDENTIYFCFYYIHWFNFSLTFCKFKEICNIFKVVKLVAIHTGIRLREALANICLCHICQSLLGVGFQQFIILFIAHNILCYFNILAIYIASLTTIHNYKEQHLEIQKQSILCYSLVIIRCWI